MRSDADRLDVRRPRLGEDRGQLLEIPLVDAGLASYVVADKSKSDIFHDFLPLLNGQLVELLDRKAGIVQERAISQLLALERTVSKQGKDSIGHPRGGVDDVINAIAGACLLARKTPSEAGKVVAMPKRQAVSPRTLNHLRPRGRVEAL